MMIDPLTAGKAELEERDRVKALAEDARAILNRIEDRDEWPHGALIAALAEHMSVPDAIHVLGRLDWEDNRHDGESDP